MGDRAYVSLLVRKEDQEKVHQILIDNSIIPEGGDFGFEVERGANVLVEFSIGEVNYADNAHEYDFLFSKEIPCIIHYGSGNSYGSGTFKGDFKDGKYTIENIECTAFLMLNVADVISMVERMESKEQLLTDLKKFEHEHNNIMVLSSSQPSP